MNLQAVRRHTRRSGKIRVKRYFRRNPRHIVITRTLIIGGAVLVALISVGLIWWILT